MRSCYDRISITLPEALALECAMVAKNLGISRSEFIRIAVRHEVVRLEKEIKLKAMAKSFLAMRKDKSAIIQLEDFDHGFGD